MHAGGGVLLAWCKGGEVGGGHGERLVMLLVSMLVSSLHSSVVGMLGSQPEGRRFKPGWWHFFQYFPGSRKEQRVVWRWGRRRSGDKECPYVPPKGDRGREGMVGGTAD